MPVLSFRLKKLSGDVGEPKTGEVRITSSIPKIKNIEEREINIGVKEKILAIEFEFKVNYVPTKASIKVEGEVLYKDENQKEILKLWKKEKKLNEEITLPLLNYIFRRCSIAAIKIADELQLLPPVKLPEFVRK